jgi:hypothetical protein
MSFSGGSEEIRYIYVDSPATIILEGKNITDENQGYPATIKFQDSKLVFNKKGWYPIYMKANINFSSKSGIIVEADVDIKNAGLYWVPADND